MKDGNLLKTYDDIECALKSFNYEVCKVLMCLLIIPYEKNYYYWIEYTDCLIPSLTIIIMCIYWLIGYDDEGDLSFILIKYLYKNGSEVELTTTLFERGVVKHDWQLAILYLVYW